MDFYRSVPNRIHFRHTILRYTKFQQTSTVKVSKGRGWKVLESSAISVGNRFPLTCTRRFGKCFDQPGERRWTSRRKKAKANAGSRSERSAGPSSETRGAADWAPSSVSRRYSGSQQVRRSRPSLSASLKKKKKKEETSIFDPHVPRESIVRQFRSLRVYHADLTTYPRYILPPFSLFLFLFFAYSFVRSLWTRSSHWIFDHWISWISNDRRHAKMDRFKVFILFEFARC